jgi:tetratricopeptide (TPR) repeat protein
MEFLDRALREKKAEQKYSEGLEFHKKQQYDKAEAAYQEAIRIDPGFYKPYVNIGTATMHGLKNPMADRDAVSRAEYYFQKALEIKPDNPIPLYNLGTIQYMQHGNEEKAFDYFARAINADPKYLAVVNQYLSFTSYSTKKDFKKVIDRSIQLITAKEIENTAAGVPVFPDLPGDLKIGDVFEWYSDQQYRISLKIPKGWENRGMIVRPDKHCEELFDFFAADGTHIGIIAGQQDYGKNATVADQEKQVPRHLEKISGTLHSLRRKTVAGVEAVDLEYTAFLTRTRKIAFLQDDVEYLITCGAKPHLFPAYEPLFEEVIGSVHFTQ